MTKKTSSSLLNLPDTTELVAVTFQLVPETDALLIPQYTIGLHAWFLDQIRHLNICMMDNQKNPSHYRGYKGK